jgi:hypothetical protein
VVADERPGVRGRDAIGPIHIHQMTVEADRASHGLTGVVEHEVESVERTVQVRRKSLTLAAWRRSSRKSAGDRESSKSFSSE